MMNQARLYQNPLKPAAEGDVTVGPADFPIQNGDNGDAVAVLQSIIKSLTCNQAAQFGHIDLGPFGPDSDGDGIPDGIDGWFGDVTEEAVKLIQKQLGWQQNGICTWTLFRFLTHSVGYSASDPTQHVQYCRVVVEPEPEPTPVDPTPVDPTPVDPTDPGGGSNPAASGDGWCRMAVVNNSSELDTTVRKWTDAVAKQLERDAAKYWGYGEVVYKTESQLEASDWLISIEDFSDLEGAGGYHSVDGGVNRTRGFDPYGKVFLDSNQPDVVLSHEALEILGDPTVNFWSMNGSALWIIELCDPVQRNIYQIDGVNVSDFVLPGWFGDFGEGPGEYHFLATEGRPTVNSPFELDSGGYQIIFNMDTRQIEYQFGAQQFDEIVTANKLVAGNFKNKTIPACEVKEVPGMWHSVMTSKIQSKIDKFVECLEHNKNDNDEEE